MIKLYLSEHMIKYDLMRHASAYSSNESALLRNEPLKVGAKALLVKGDKLFYLIVISASLKIDSKKIKKELSIKKLRFATEEELFQLTGLVPGSVPPFGNPILPFFLMIDQSITQLSYIAFNAGLLDTSIKMNMTDYLKISNGKLVDVALLDCS